MYRGEAPSGNMTDFNMNTFLEGATREFPFIINDIVLQCQPGAKEKLLLELAWVITGQSLLSTEEIGSSKPDNGRYIWKRVGMSLLADIFSNRKYSLQVTIFKKGKFVMPDRKIHRWAQFYRFPLKHEVFFFNLFN